MEAESECQQCQPNLLQSENFAVKISLVAFNNRQGVCEVIYGFYTVQV